MSYFPLVLHYADRALPESVNRPHEVREGVKFKLVSIFPTLGESLEVERVKLGWRVSDETGYSIESTKHRAIIGHFDRIAGH